MIPLRDVIPSRTTPWITIGLIAAGLAIGIAAGTSWLALAADTAVFWVFGETIEDRLDHWRFAAFFLVGVGVALAIASTLAPVALPWTAAAALGCAGGAAATMGAHFSLFRNARVLVVVPGVPVNVAEVPAMLIAAAWFALHAIAIGPIEAALIGRGLLAAEAAGFLTGAALARVLRRKARMAPDWWSA